MSFKVGLALGGGAARGMAHLGVLKVLEEEGIKIDIITGASIGGIVAALYALDPLYSSCVQNIKRYIHSDVFGELQLGFMKQSGVDKLGYFSGIKKLLKQSLVYALSLSRESFISEEEFSQNLLKLVPDENFEDCTIKLGLTAINLESGEEVLFQKGRLIPRIMASCAIPGIFPVIKVGGNELIDGSWGNPIPVEAAKQLGADFVIAVDIAPTMSDDVNTSNGFEISLRAAEASRQNLRRYNLKEADFSITVDVMDIHWADFSKLNRCIAEGENRTRAEVKNLKNKIKWKKIRSSVGL